MPRTRSWCPRLRHRPKTRAVPSENGPHSYDANGNTAVINAAGSLTTNTWDIENHLTAVQLPAGGRTTATYDGGGKRRSYEDSVMLHNFIWDGENILFQTDNSNTLDRDYTYNPRGYVELVSQRGLFHHGVYPLFCPG